MVTTTFWPAKYLSFLRSMQIFGLFAFSIIWYSITFISATAAGQQDLMSTLQKQNQVPFQISIVMSVSL